ncbi:MAG: hypothetical protein ABL971_14295 [Vicinamibacterales bacterium]
MTVYDRSPADSAVIDMLLNYEHLTFQDADAVVSFRRRPALRFSDCLVVEVARQSG